MSNESDVQEIDINIEHARKLVALKDSLERLTLSNTDFKEVFLEGYFKNEAIRLVNAKADPELADEENQKRLLVGIDSIGQLQLYLRSIMQTGRYLEEQIKNDLATKEELLAEAEAE